VPIKTVATENSNNVDRPVSNTASEYYTRRRGLFIRADATSTQIEVAGTLITVPTEKIASIDFTERKPTQLAPEPPSLAIEAAVIYNFGGAQPFARIEIVLLDQSLPQVLRDAGLHGGDLD
jgi:hypothetical protein